MSPSFSSSAAWVLTLALPALIRCQTFSTCNPIQKAGCPDEPAFGAGTFSSDFTKGADDSVFTPEDGTTLTYSPSTGALFSIQAPNDAPTIHSNKYIFFGRLDVVMQAAPGAGIITSIVLQSEDLDEIDYELVGSDTGHVQTNYFHQGNTTTYDRGATYAVDSPMTGLHTYSVLWTAESIQWLYDGAVLRTLTYNDAYGGLTYPQSPMRVKLGTWVAGKAGTPQGTIDWAGGLANFNNQPFNAYYKSVTLADYSNGVANAVSYSYGGMSGTYNSIIVGTSSGRGSIHDTTHDSISSSSASVATPPPPSSTKSFVLSTPSSFTSTPHSEPATSSHTSRTSPSSLPSSPSPSSTSPSSPSPTTSKTPTGSPSMSQTLAIASPTTIYSSVTLANNATATFTPTAGSPVVTSPVTSTSVTASPVTSLHAGSAPRSSISMAHLFALGVAFFLAHMLL